MYAFVGYAGFYPKGFMALVDSYSTLESGIKNFICVAAVLIDLGYKPIGIRLDSGKLSYLSQEAKKLFKLSGEILNKDFSSCVVVASNDINENKLK